MSDKTLKEHLAHARSLRDKAEHSKQMKQAQKARWEGIEPKACTCNTTTEKHKSLCPVYRREQWRNRQKGTGQ